MIKRYCFGTPINTDAVVKQLTPEREMLPCKEQEEGLVFQFDMAPSDRVYGLGEAVRGMNKRGWQYVSYAADDPNHQEDTKSLYGAHNFLIVDGEKKWGIFVDYPGKVIFDIGYEKLNQMVITVTGKDVDVYRIDGESALEIVTQFRKLIGKSYIPPKWAFGLGQSRWGYRNEADILEVVEKYKENEFPIDSVYMDIDYMEDLKDFTVSKERYPDLPALSKQLKEKHKIHLVPIIDAGVKIEKGYDVYEEGVEKGYFCKDKDGNPFALAVWPGLTHFPDVFREDVREWFGNFYKRLMDQGIDGFWNDMNEPSIFYTKDGLKRLQAAYETVQGKEDLDLKVWFGFLGSVGSLSHSPIDHAAFYHTIDGKQVRHDKVHNLFGTNLTKAAAQAFERIEPDKRILMFSRSSYVGMHRYSGIWMGDNKSWWSHLLMNIQMLPGLNMVGLLYTGADMGGFGSDATEDLLMRWMAVSAFTPLMRNHSTDGSRFQEPYRFENKAGMKALLQARYELIPYLYSEFVKCALEDRMMFTPLAFAYPSDSVALEVEDQLLVGESIMIAPVYKQNTTGRTVYLPEPMKLIYLGAEEDLEGKVLEVGWHYIDVPIDRIPVFIKAGHLLPLGRPVDNVEQLRDSDLRLLGFEAENATYIYYNDDGYSKDFENREHYKTLRLE